MKSLFFYSIFCFLIFITIVTCSFSQESIKSKIEIDRDRDLLRTNKVKEIIIEGNQGLLEKTKIDISGTKVETKGFYNNQESSIVNYKYDEKFNLIEESYYGYESGDGISTKYYYDETGNVIGDEEVWGGDESKGPENHYYYDEFGNINRMIKYGTETNYDNQYVEGNLVSTSEICKVNDSLVYVIKYTYDKENRISEENSFYKKCSNDEFEITENKKYSYYENGLIKRIEKEGKYTDGLIFLNYTYKIY